jgi:hypothetical protein
VSGRAEFVATLALVAAFVPAATPALAAAPSSAPLVTGGQLVAAGTGEAMSLTATSGDYVFAGAPSAAVGPYSGGAVLVFQEPAAGWSGPVLPSATLTASDGSAGNQLGQSMAWAGARSSTSL